MSTAATVDGQPVTTTTGPSRLTVRLGGVLPDEASATMVLHLVIPLGQALDGDAWFHAYRDGIIQVSQWLPRVDRGSPMSSRRACTAPPA